MKQYIKNMSVEEVISKLKKGEVIRTVYNTQYKMINGVLCYISCDNKVYVNSGFSHDNDRGSYFEVPDPIKLEVGKTYKTYDGNKVVISIYNKETKSYTGIIVGRGYVNFWDENGKFNPPRKHHLDIVSEWSD